MARPERNNVDYFPFLCKEGKAMFYIEQKYGNDGYATWIKILRQLAVTNYHFLNLNDKVEFMFLASKCRITEELLTNIINDLCQLGEFHNDLWHQNKVIWSEKFYESVKDAYLMRKNKCIDLQGLLIHLSSLGISKLSKTDINNTVNTQSRVEKKKLENSIVENNFAEQSSAYQNLVKSKESIFEFIKKQNPKFLEPYFDYWNIFAQTHSFPKLKSLSKSRRTKINTRLNEKQFEFTKILKKLTECTDFTKTWLTFDWILESENNYVKILEGNYDKSRVKENEKPNVNTNSPEYRNLDGR